MQNERVFVERKGKIGELDRSFDVAFWQSQPTLLKLFNANNVRYLVIGGYAVVQHAEPRFTKDLDLWISTDTQNARDLVKAKRASGRQQDLLDADLLEQFENE